MKKTHSQTDSHTHTQTASGACTGPSCTPMLTKIETKTLNEKWAGNVFILCSVVLFYTLASPHHLSFLLLLQTLLKIAMKEEEYRGGTGSDCNVNWQGAIYLKIIIFNLAPEDILIIILCLMGFSFIAFFVLFFKF